MNQEKWYQVVLPRDRFTVAVGSLEWAGEVEWVVKQAAPVADWMRGIAIHDIKMWVHQNGGRIEELRDSQARIVLNQR